MQSECWVSRLGCAGGRPGPAPRSPCLFPATQNFATISWDREEVVSWKIPHGPDTCFLHLQVCICVLEVQDTAAERGANVGTVALAQQVQIMRSPQPLCTQAAHRQHRGESHRAQKTSGCPARQLLSPAVPGRQG